MKLNDQDFLSVIRNTVLIAVDLIVRDDANRILLGKRLNSPAKGFWFVPGGRLFKAERFQDAVARIAEEELGVSLDLKDFVFRGISEHFYPDNFFEIPNLQTHYFLLVAEIRLSPNQTASLNLSQHSEFRFFSAEEIKENPEVHAFTRAYFSPASSESFLPFQTPTTLVIAKEQ